MIHNLTPNQLKGLRWLVAQVKDANIEESFGVGYDAPLFVGEREIKFVVGDVARGNYLVAPDYLIPGVLNALVDSHALVFDSKNDIYTLTRKAYEIAAFDNPEPSPITLYIKETIPLITNRFDLQEFDNDLCFELGVDPERHIENKKYRERELCLYLWRVGRLQELTPVLQKLRSNFDDWPIYPGQQTAVTGE